MMQATPAIRDLARLLLALEAHRSEDAEGETDTILSVFAQVQAHLSKIVGIAGFQALLSRALVLAKADVGWLASVRVEADATLETFRKVAQQQPAAEVLEGSVALLAQLLSLLVTFIGEALTLRLVQEVWPEAQLGDRNSSAEEIRHE